MNRDVWADTAQVYERVLAPLRGQAVWDVQTPGYIDRENRVPRFVPLGRTVYLALESGDYLRMDPHGDLGHLYLRIVDDVEFPEELRDDEDDEFSVSSSCGHFLGDNAVAQRIVRVRYALNSDSDPLLATVRCIEFEFHNNERLFVDPSYHWGIRLQSRGAYEHWLREVRERPETSGPVREYLWTA
ncbi:hypothetical protein [Streptomyces sp. DSM 40907]|uniref:hypothetical protein n=1 Tax=Streptomyces kutzneri TaxID=3051179 RepID=UPI0028D8CB81|nr:hypothetical protein [Streptomyces sp. DSM 40907]